MYTLADVVGALVPLAGLAELSINSRRPAEEGRPDAVPAALGQLKGLRSLQLFNMRPCILEAGCLDLPVLESLEFTRCDFEGADVLLGVAALRCLTSIAFLAVQGLHCFHPELVQLPRLARLVLSQDIPLDVPDHGVYDGAPAGLFRLPADMGLLSLSLVDLEVSGLRLTHFPDALTQLVALERLVANKNEFAKLPASVTALSRLTELALGRLVTGSGILRPHKIYPLDVRALGDLSAFPALRTLSFAFCEVALCVSLPGGAVQHPSLESICFCLAHPAPDCVPMVLQLSQELRRLRGGSVVKVAGNVEDLDLFAALMRCAQALLPFQIFKAALAGCALCGAGSAEPAP